MAVSHIFTSPVVDMTGTVTVFNSLGVTATTEATALVRPSNWNSVHNQYMTISGNTAGVSTLSGTNIVLQGGNNVTLSANGVSLIVSGPNTVAQSVQTQNMVSINGSTGAIVFSNSNNVSFGVNASTITATATFPAQSVVPGIQSIQVSDTTYTTGNVIFSNANGASFGSSAGGAVTLSYTRPVVSNAIQPVGSATGSGTNTSRFAADDHVHEGVFSMGVSTAGNTSNDTRVGAGRFVLQGGNNVTLSQITAAGGLNTIVFSGGAAGGADGVNALVVNAGASTVSTTLTLSNSNNVSFGIAAGVITATVTVPAQTNQTLSLAATSNTAGNTSGMSVDARSITMAGYGIASVGYSTSAGGSTIVVSASQTVQTQASGNIARTGITTGATAGSQLAATHDTAGISLGVPAWITTSPAQTNQTGGIYFTAQTTGQSSSSTYDLRTLSIVGDGIVSAGWSNGTVRISATQSNQAFSADASSTFQTLTFQNSNGISFSNNAGALRITHDLAFSSQTNLTGRIYVTAQSTGQSSSSTYDLRTLSIVPDGIISAGWSGGSFRISATQSNQAVSNSAGSFTFQTLNFSNANNVTFGTSAGGIITASVAAGGGGIAASLSGNSTSGGAGYSNITSGTMILAGGPNITLSQDGSRISISANAPGVAAENNWMNLLGANTSGNTTASGSTLGLSGINMTLSGTNGSVINLSVPATSSLSATGAVSISTNGSTISIGAPNFSVSRLEQNWGTATVNVWNNATFSRRPIFVPFEMHAHLSAVSSIQIAVSRSGGTSLACTYFAGIYTLANSTSMNLLSSTSFNVSLTTSAQFSGIRVMNFTGLGAMSLTPGQYVMGFLASDGGTASNGLNMLGDVVFNNAGFILSGTNSTAATASNSLLAPMFGVFNATSGSMPGAVAFSSISGGASANAARVGFVLRAN